MRKLFRFAIIAFFLFLLGPLYLFAQSARPVSAKHEIDLHIGEDGKLSGLPVGFALIDAKTYDFSVTVDPPKKQHDALLKYLSGKIKTTLEKLNDPTLNNGALLPGIVSDTTGFKAQLFELQTILDSHNPDSALNASGSSFSYLLGKKFLQDHLFGKIFIVNTAPTGAPIAFKYNETAAVKISILASAADQPVMIRVTNLQDQFIADYFTESRKQIDALIKGLHANQFYHTSVAKEIPQLLKDDSTAAAALNPLVTQHKPVICDPALYNNIQNLVTSCKANPLLKIIATNWLANWIWYNEGSFKLNPLNFTDAGLLNLAQGYNKVKADNYDKYVKGKIDLMVNTNTLEAKKPSPKTIDSLNQQLDQGSKIYSVDAANAALVKQNSTAAAALQDMQTVVDSISFRVVTGDNRNNYFLKIYDASAKLKAGVNNKVEGLPTSTSVELMAYNLKPNESFVVTETTAAITDQSDAIAQLNTLGDTESSLVTQAGLAGPLISGILGLFNTPPPATPQVVISAPIQPGTVGPELVPQPPNTAKPYHLVAKSIGGHFYIDASDRIGRRSGRVDVSKIVDGLLTGAGINDCPYMNTLIKAGIDTQLTASDHYYATEVEYEAEKTKLLADVKTKIVNIVQFNIDKLSVRNAVNTLKPLTSQLIVAKTLYLSGAYILPPKELKPADDPASPAYHNQYYQVTNQTSATQMSLAMAVMNSTTKTATTKATDVYKTSPAHWVTASLGVGYIFNAFQRNSATVASGVIANVPDQAQTRLIAGLSFYPFPIVLTNSHFITGLSWRELPSRFSIFTGVSFPDPLYNLHAGLSADLWPGIKITGGFHFYRFTNYTIVDDQITNQQSYYVYNKYFMSLTIEPVTFVKLIGLLN